MKTQCTKIYEMLLAQNVENFIALYVYIRTKERLKLKISSSTLKKLEKGKQIEPKVMKINPIIQVRVEIIGIKKRKVYKIRS